MPDLYLSISSQSDDVIEAVAASMDKRAAEPEMRRICADYMRALPQSAEVLLEIGCGNGSTTGLLLENARPRALVGVDPSEGLIERGRRRFRDDPVVEFLVGDALATGQGDGMFDVVVAHTVFSHLADPQGALAEAWRVLRPGGTLAIFDGDYATNTVALFDGDPLQATMTAAQRNLIHDPYVMRRLPALVRAAGFGACRTRAHGYMQTETPDYLLSLIGRSVDAAAAAGEFGSELAAGLASEASRRVADGTFYGAILFVSLIAEKPLDA
ncbi:methyltransferase domain-containing protein [Oricola sp.]|uniref:methyltransferase domain-containing protein n=1 Tax=Oricola sp. TaxID=1979950 RepID=UPI0025CE050A|nr:methyltransferase domain-containing protein [Oricola sp.]MCI5077203.1 methyltransferase domain-containing protein [Oricola sp.]